MQMSSHESAVYLSDTPEETQQLGRCLGPGLRCGDVIALHGDLGAGKTCFVQGLAQGMQVLGRVSSPTFIIMRQHNPGGHLDCALYHVDAYRLQEGEELWEMGLEDWLYNGAVVVEWAERVQAALPEERLEIHVEMQGDRRQFSFMAFGARPRQILEYLTRCEFWGLKHPNM